MRCARQAVRGSQCVWRSTSEGGRPRRGAELEGDAVGPQLAGDPVPSLGDAGWGHGRGPFPFYHRGAVRLRSGRRQRIERLDHALVAPLAGAVGGDGQPRISWGERPIGPIIVVVAIALSLLCLGLALTLPYERVMVCWRYPAAPRGWRHARGGGFHPLASAAVSCALDTASSVYRPIHRATLR